MRSRSLVTSAKYDCTKPASALSPPGTPAGAEVVALVGGVVVGAVVVGVVVVDGAVVVGVLVVVGLLLGVGELLGVGSDVARRRRAGGRGRCHPRRLRHRSPG